VSAIGAGGLSPDDVGARVSVRRHVDGGVGDVVGDLESLDADGLAIRSADGSLVLVAAAAVVAARVVGPSMRAAFELEAVSGRSWPALDNEWLGQWWLRAAGGFTARANAVRVLGDPGVALDDALAFAADWYARRELPLRLRVVDGSSVDQELGRRGWDAEWETSIQAATIASLQRRLDKSPAPVRLTTTPPPSWLLRFRDGALPASAVEVLTGGGEVRFATIESGSSGAATAIGRAAVEPPWVGFAAIEVDPGARRRGHARAVMSALTGWAAERGAVRAWLEVLADNEAALALYAALGFTEHHRYRYRVPPIARNRPPRRTIRTASP
jgi:GNAT superfamily N-acetyltransferase